MLTDLRLRKYLEGLLSEEDAREVEALLEKSPELKARLESLKARSEVAGRPMWERVLMGRKDRRGSRTRATILLPLLLAIGVILALSGHWFSPPGENSTFTLADGNGTSLELLYDSESGWRFLDAGYRAGDSLSFSVRDSGSWHVAVLAIYGRGNEARVATLWADSPDRRYSRESAKPTFLPEASAGTGRPGRIVVFYDDVPLPELPAERVLDIVETRGNERGGLDFHYQVFSSGP
jgi:hypothetical protein